MLSKVFRSSLSDSRLLGVIAPSVLVFVVGSLVIGRAVVERRDAWLLGDWLIDYSAGFSRRGLIGEGIRQVAGFLGIDRIMLTATLIWVVFTAVLFVVTALFLHQYRGYTTVLLLVSPAFLFVFLNFLGTMRKELLLFLLVGVVLLVTKLTRQGAWGWLLAGLFPVLVFAHEGLALYGLFVLIVVFLLYSEGLLTKKHAIWQGSVTTALTALTGWGLSRRGDSAGIDQQICDNLIDEGYSKRLCGGAIAFLDRTPEEAIARVAGLVVSDNYLTTYALVVALAAIPFIFVRLSKTLLVLFATAAFLTVPLFMVAIDWGRWIVISVWLITLVAVRFDRSPHIQVRPIHPKTLTSDLLLIAAVMSYAMLWSVPHCCEPRIGFGIIDRLEDLVRLL